ncbi:MAG TPA: glycosyltransferase family 4 protein [Candidatus Paceibacterota bacterium]|nr:glycosyltransferase family 4 protein [Candidatus Paceibacterota bacterium]
MNLKMYYVINARLPNKKAYGIQVAKMCEAFIEAGVDLELVIPRTHASQSTSMRDFYQLRVDVPTTILPTVDWYAGGRIGYYVSASIFAISCFFYLIIERIKGKRGIFYSIPDTFSLVAGLAAGMDCYLEIHEMLLQAPLLKLLRVAHGLIATNPMIAESLRKILGGQTHIIVEPNAVDLDPFEHVPSKEESRQQVHLPSSEQIVLYIGRFYAWKGLGILVAAAARAPSFAWYVVGGTREEFMQVTGSQTVPANLHVVGECTLDEVPLWQATADVLLILGTKENEQSYRNTTPMKVYEYMASNRPIVASHTPALTSVMQESEVTFYEPDDAQNLVDMVTKVFENVSDSQARVTHAYQSAMKHTWTRRVARILSFI